MTKPGTAWASTGRRQPNDPMVRGDDRLSSMLRRLWAAWRRWMTDEEGF